MTTCSKCSQQVQFVCPTRQDICTACARVLDTAILSIPGEDYFWRFIVAERPNLLDDAKEHEPVEMPKVSRSADIRKRKKL